MRKALAGLPDHEGPPVARLRSSAASSAFSIRRGDGCHGLIKPNGVEVGGYAITLQEDQRGSHGSALVAVNKRLGLGDVVAVGRRYIEELTLPVKVNVPGMDYRRFQQKWISNAMRAAKAFDRFLVKLANLLDGQEAGFVHDASFCNKTACRFKTWRAAASKARSSMSATGWAA